MIIQIWGVPAGLAKHWWISKRRLTWGADSAAVVLPLEEVFVTYWAHAIRTWVPIKSTSSGTQHRHLGLVGLLSHPPRHTKRPREPSSNHKLLYKHLSPHPPPRSFKLSLYKDVLTQRIKGLVTVGQFCVLLPKRKKNPTPGQLATEARRLAASYPLLHHNAFTWTHNDIFFHKQTN